MKKIYLPIILGLSSCFSVNAMAQHNQTNYKDDAHNQLAAESSTMSGLTGDFTFTSNYMFRGTTVSNNLPALQGTLTYTFLSNGIYLSLWGSNVEFPDTQGKTATVEFDTTLGIANPIGDNFGYDISINRYNYPKASADYSELIGKANWYFLTGEIAYSTNVYNYHKTGTYYNIGFNYDIPANHLYQIKNVNISGGVGHYSLTRSAGLSSYNDYNLGISKTCGRYNLALVWTDTGGSSFNLANDPSKAGRGSHLTASVTASF